MSSPASVSTRRHKGGLSIEQHQLVGATLRSTKDTLLRIFMDVQRAYPTSSRAVRVAGRIVADLDRLRSAMDDELYRDLRHPGLDAARIYYGGPR